MFNYGDISPDGKALGRYQMKKGALKDTGMMDKNGNWTGKNGVFNEDDFLGDARVQDDVMDEFMAKNERYLNNKGATKHLGQKIDGIRAEITVTEAGLLAAAHRQGAGRVNQYLDHLEKYGWISIPETFPRDKGNKSKNAFLSVETRLREFQDIPYRNSR